jgi:drug/metabolite transporter (DMT)-like permease
MSLSALCLVLIAALLHATWNLVAKKAGGDSRFALLSSLMIVVLWAPVGIWAAWGEVPLWGAKEWALIFASGITHLVYFNVLLRGYAASDLTVVYPVARGTGPLISSFGALLLLDEHMSLGGVLGVFAVTGGVFLIAGGPSLWARAHDPVQRQRVMAGLGYGAATGCMIALYTLIDGYSVKVMLISPILIDYFGNLARLPFMLPSALRKPEAFMASARALWKHALVLAAISPLGYILVLYAARLAPLSHVAPAREVSMLFAALLGGRLLGEGERGTRIAGAACIAVGVVGLAAG